MTIRAIIMMVLILGGVWGVMIASVLKLQKMDNND
jgi:hypothetical protein